MFLSDSGDDDDSVRPSKLYVLHCNYTASYDNYDEKIDTFRALAKVEIGKDGFI